jgi:site-specific recombinase XerD
MDSAECAEGTPAMLRAVRFRDGLVLAIQSYCVLRLSNLVMLQVGRHVVQTSEGYWLLFTRDEMKGRRPHEMPLPARLTPYLTRYLQVWHPVLLKTTNTDAFWISIRANAMKRDSIQRLIKMLTARHFKKSMSPHLFRHAAATYVAEHDPEHVRIAQPLLGHAHSSTTDRYILKGVNLRASRSYNALIRELREQLTSVGRAVMSAADGPRGARKRHARSNLC